MSELMDLTNEYNECFNLIGVSTVQTLDWNRIKNLISLLTQNPLNFIFINNIYVRIGEMVVNETFINPLATSCPYENAKHLIYQVGIPFYYDPVRINSLFYKFILKDQFCMCNLPNCQFKPPIPDMKYLPQLQAMIPKI